MSSQETKGKLGKGVLNFFVSTVMFLILFAITIVVMGVAVFGFLELDFEMTTALTVGIVLSLAYAALVYIIPFLRRISSVRYYAWLAIGDAIWWAGCLLGIF